MIGKCTVLSVVDRIHKDKPACDVVLMFTDPTEAVTVTLWHNSIAAGHDKAYKALVGQEVFAAVQYELYNGQKKYSLYTATPPVPVNPVRQNKPAQVA